MHRLVYFFYRLITLNRFLSKISLKGKYNVCHKGTIKWNLESLVFNKPFVVLKLSGLGGIRAHIKAIKIIMENFQR